MCVFAAFSALPAAADDAAAQASSFTGLLRSSNDYYPYHLGGEPTADLVPYVSTELSFKTKLNQTAHFSLKLFALANPESKSAPEKLYADLPEALLEWKIGDFKLRGGMNTLSWGIVDTSSPSDVTNTQVLFHPLRTFKQGAPMVEATYGQESFGIHALYIPWQRRPLLPSEDSRWLPRRFLLNTVEGHTRVNLPTLSVYKYDPAETLNEALSNNYGLKLHSHLGALALQLTHFEGASPSPKVRTMVTVVASGTDAQAQSPIRISPVTYRVRTTGFGAAYAFENLIVRAESAYQHTISKDPLLQPWSWASVLALETNVDVGASSMIWLLRYYHTENPQAPDGFISSSYRLFDETAVLGTRWAYSDDLTINGSVLYEARDRGWFLTAGFDQKLSNVLNWGMAWRELSASRDGWIKTYERNDHASMEITYYF
ncbi:MAG: hypothetical protein KF799_06275 [Bdellovibrionales bacterium]|nr:hypothetical protein [Bdellovibrionales bacterium]